MVYENMLYTDTIENRVTMLLNSIIEYLDRVDPFNNRLCGILNTIKANLAKLELVDEKVKDKYLLDTLNYLEKLNHSYYGDMVTYQHNT